MNSFILYGTITVTLALISYTIAIGSEQLRGQVTRSVLSFLTLGVCLDVSATICMIAGSSQTGITLHGLLGYSALLAMCTDACLMWRHQIRTRTRAAEWSRACHLYSRYAYLWWLFAFITGTLLVALRQR